MLRIEIAFAQQTSSMLGLYSLNRNFAIIISAHRQFVVLKGYTSIILLKDTILSYHLLGRDTLDIIVFVTDNNALASQCFFLKHPLLGQFKTIF